MGLIFAELATSLKSPKIDTAKNKPYYTSSLRVLEIAKIGLGENLAHLPCVVFAKISRRAKFPIYSILFLLKIFRSVTSCLLYYVNYYLAQTDALVLVHLFCYIPPVSDCYYSYYLFVFMHVVCRFCVA